MKTKLTAFFLIILITALCVISVPSAYAEGTDRQRAADIYNGIVAFELSEADATSVQEWIDGGLADGAGATSEWFILALCQSGAYDFSSYRTALLNYLEKNEVYSATSRQKYALCLSGTGGTDGYISAVLENSIGEQGIMSYIYGLHLLNNGYTSTKYTAEQLAEKLVSLRGSDGGWALGGSADTDITAMAVQALAPHYTNEKVKEAVDGALDILSARQLSDGDYSSYGVSNPESTAQVIVALSSLGIECQTDARFIKDGKTLFDGIEKYRLSDGSFSHTLGGETSGSATSQVFYAVTAYIRNADGRSPLYILDNSRPEDVQPAPTVKADGNTENTSGNTDISDVPAATSGKTTEKSAEKHSYKPYAVIAVAAVGVAVCLVLFIFKRRSVKSYIAVLLVTAIGITVVCLTDIRTPSEYYGVSVTKEAPIGTVTLTIRCDTVAGEDSSEHIPANGIILDVTELEIEEGDTVYSILTDAAQAYGIHVDSSGGASLTYVSGINYLYEFDFGELSGWVYRVNGVSPDVGCGEYKLSDGDTVEWHYTRELGNDIS